MDKNTLITMPVSALEQIIATGAEIALNRANTSKKEYISQSAAFKKYGRRSVERWQKEGKITPVKQVGLIKYKVQKLDELSAVNELHSSIIERELQIERQ